jgi:hypothetical protein
MKRMRLYLLEPIDPYEEPYDYCDVAEGFVVRAKDEMEARMTAGEQAGEEGADAWKDQRLTRCQEILLQGDACIILKAFRAG